MKKETVVTRPGLASILMEKGYKAVIGKNPYRPELTAWTFELDKEGLSMVKSYYDRLKGGDLT